MSDIPKQATIKHGGKESIVQFIQMWGEDILSIVLAHPKTERLQEFCTVNIPDVPLGPEQALVMEKFVGVLAEAGVIRPTEQGIVGGKFGKLRVCDVVDHPPHLAWEWENSPRKVAQRLQEESKDVEDPDLDIER